MHVKNRFNIVLLVVLFLFISPVVAFAGSPVQRGAFLDQYSWFEIVNPLLIVGLAAIFAGYLWMMRDVSRKSTIEHRGWKCLSFFVGLLIIYFSLGGPIAIYANNLVFSAHMAQQGLMYMGMPLLVLLGMPRVFYEWLDEKLFARQSMRFFKSPIVSILLFNLLLSFFQIPFIYEFLAERFVLLEAAHVVITAAAFLMWIHVLAPSGLVNNMSNVLKIGYMFLNGLLLMPLSALVIFADGVIYPSINDAPLPFSFSTPYDDQKLGGIVIQTMQQIFYMITITFTFFRWAKEAKVLEVDDLPEHPYENN